MGNLFSSFWKKLFKSKKELKVMMIGLDSAGKTTILYRMQMGDKIPNPRPTIGFNLEEISYKNFKLKVWDLSGQEKLRQVWKHYYQSVDGIVFVIDANDRKRFPDARDEFHKIIDLAEHDINVIKVLIMANKQDLDDPMSGNEIESNLGIGIEFIPKIKIQETVAVKGVGLLEGFDWLIDQIELTKSKK